VAGYFVGAVMLVASAGLLATTIGLLVRNLEEAEENLQRIALPGTETLALHKAGSYTVYHEVASGTPGNLGGLGLTIRDVNTGQQIDIEAADGSESYSFGSRHGRAVAHFETTAPTSVEVAGSYPGGKHAPVLTLAIGPPLIESILPMIAMMLVGIGGAVVLLFGGMGFAVVAFMRRQKRYAAQ